MPYISYIRGLVFIRYHCKLCMCMYNILQSRMPPPPPPGCLLSATRNIFRNASDFRTENTIRRVTSLRYTTLPHVVCCSRRLRRTKFLFLHICTRFSIFFFFPFFFLLPYSSAFFLLYPYNTMRQTDGRVLFISFFVALQFSYRAT